MLNSRTIASCYAALPIIDYSEEDTVAVLKTISRTINDLLVVSIARREQSIQYKDSNIRQDDFYSYSGKELITIGDTIEDTAIRSIEQILEIHSKDVITVFYRPEFEDAVTTLSATIAEQGIEADFIPISVESLPCLMTISFE